MFLFIVHQLGLKGELIRFCRPKVKVTNDLSKDQIQVALIIFLQSLHHTLFTMSLEKHGRELQLDRLAEVHNHKGHNSRKY